MSGNAYNDKNYGSDCFAFLQWISNGKIGWRQAVMILADEYGISAPDDKNAVVYQNIKYGGVSKYVGSKSVTGNSFYGTYFEHT